MRHCHRKYLRNAAVLPLTAGLGRRRRYFLKISSLHMYTYPECEEFAIKAICLI